MIVTWLEVLLAAAALAGGGLLTGRVASATFDPWVAIAVIPFAWMAGYAIWDAGIRLARRLGVDVRDARRYGALPLLPWLASWPVLIAGTFDTGGRVQLETAGGVLLAYLSTWTVAGLAGLWLWLQSSSFPSAPANGDGIRQGAESEAANSTLEVPSRGHPSEIGSLAGRPIGVSAASVSLSHASAAWPIGLLLLAFAATLYWNGAVLDPLRFRGFPDYVTQMGGARRLLDGLLPYDPTIRVWTDVNLPPITLLLLFAPFANFSELGGKLAYFTLNHLAFLGGLALLVGTLKPPRRTIAPLLWGSIVIAAALAFEPWHDSLRLGQQNGIVFFFLALSAVAAAKRWESFAGIGLAAALIGKPSSALLGLYFLVAGRWRAVIAAAVAGLAVFLVTLPLTGIESWRFYLLEKAPEIMAGTPQQSNVALLAFHARLFLPLTALASFDAMPAVPLAVALTRTAQVLGVLALWRFVTRRRRRTDQTGLLVEFAFSLVLSLSLVGHAWQSYVSWLVIAFVALADPRLWHALPTSSRAIAVPLGAFCYAALAVNDVTLHRVTGSTSAVAALFASLPNLSLLVLAFVLALLLRAYDHAASAAGAPSERAGETDSPEKPVGEALVSGSFHHSFRRASTGALAMIPIALVDYRRIRNRRSLGALMKWVRGTDLASFGSLHVAFGGTMPMRHGISSNRRERPERATRE
jgi:hypothetical protein